MKKLIEIEKEYYDLIKQIGDIGLYNNSFGEKFIIKNEKIQNIRIAPAIGVPEIKTQKINSLERVSEYLALVTIAGKSGYIWIKGKHLLKPELQPNLSINIFISGHQQIYAFPMSG